MAAGTQNRRTLAAINNILEGKVDKDVQSYMINGRQLYKMPTEDLLRLQAEYTKKCVIEAGGTAFPQVTFR